MVTFSDFGRLSYCGDVPRSGVHKRHILPSKSSNGERQNLRWYASEEFARGFYELHARHDGGHRITTGCIPIYAHPTRKQKVKDPNTAKQRKQEEQRTAAREAAQLFEQKIKQESLKAVGIEAGDGAQESTTTRSGRRSRKPTSFREKIEFSSGSEDDTPSKKKKRRSGGPRRDNTGGEYTIRMSLRVLPSKAETLKPFPLKFRLEQLSHKVLVAEIEPGIENSSFRHIQAGDELVSVNNKNIELMGFDQGTDVDKEISKMCYKKKWLLLFKGTRKKMINRIATLMYVPIEPQEIYDACENLGGVEVVRKKCLWQVVREKLGLTFTTSSGHTLNKAYTLYFDQD